MLPRKKKTTKSFPIESTTPNKRDRPSEERERGGYTKRGKTKKKTEKGALQVSEKRGKTLTSAEEKGKKRKEIDKEEKTERSSHFQKKRGEKPLLRSKKKGRSTNFTRGKEMFLLRKGHPLKKKKKEKGKRGKLPCQPPWGVSGF